jgi:hypothetical protein
MEKLRDLHYELLEHPPYSPDLAASDSCLFPKLKLFLAGQRFSSNKEVFQAVERYFADLTKNHYRDGIMVLEHRWNKCLSLTFHLKIKIILKLKIWFFIVRPRTFQTTLVKPYHYHLLDTTILMETFSTTRESKCSLPALAKELGFYACTAQVHIVCLSVDRSGTRCFPSPKRPIYSYLKYKTENHNSGHNGTDTLICFL